MYLPHRYAYITTAQHQDKQEKMAIYPFHVDYSSGRKKKMFVKLPKFEVESTQPIASDSPSSEEQQQQEYSESFESYDSFQEQPISQESDPLSQSINPKPQQTFPRFLSNHIQYTLLSETQLRKQNQRLVLLKQQFRNIASKYKHNLFIMHRQRQELSMLRNKKKKALDVDYEYSLSQEFERKRDKSQQVEESIGRVRRVMKMEKLRRLKEEVLFDDPDNASCVMSDSRLLDHRAALLVTLLTKRQEVLSKRRQSDRYEAYFTAQQRKEEQYKQLIDMYDGMIAKGSTQGLEKRVQFLKREIELKMAMATARELQGNLMIVTMQNEISSIQMRIGQLERTKAERILKINEQPKTTKTKVKLDPFARKKISSQLIPKAKLQQDIPPNTRIKLAFPSSSQTPTTPTIQPSLFKANRQRLRQHTTHQ